ncbi:MAG: hypothetical protein ACXABO_17230 [Promethearchaeota archaeon]|jgi:hypothetical protein
MITKTEFFNEIFEEFVCEDNRFNNYELWKSNSIIKLMRISKEVEDKRIVGEGLKIILSLCNYREYGNLVDYYESESYSVEELKEPDKILFESILLAEFI